MAAVATSTTTKKTSSGPTPIADVTGNKRGPRKGVARGPLTKPQLTKTQERLGAITNKAREIAARNSGYVNAQMIYLELADHPEYQKLVFGPEGVQPATAYSLLTPAKVKDWYEDAIETVSTVLHATTGERVPKIHALTGEPVDPYVDYEEGGPKKGALPRLATMRGGAAFVDPDEL